MNRTKKKVHQKIEIALKFTKEIPVKIYSEQKKLHMKSLIIYIRLIGLRRKFYKRISCKFDLGSFYKEILCIHLNGNPLYFFDFILQGNPFDFFTKEFPEKFYREILLLFFDF